MFLNSRVAVLLMFLCSACLLVVFPFNALAHGVADGDQAFISSGSGSNVFAYLYLGAKHMVTGYDHLLFLVGVIFFLYKMREVCLLYTSPSPRDS